MRRLEDELRIDSIPQGRMIVAGRKISKEETLKDKYIYEEMLKLGYDLYEFTERVEYDKKKYEEYASIARRCLESDIEIPQEVKE